MCGFREMHPKEVHIPLSVDEVKEMTKNMDLYLEDKKILSGKLVLYYELR